MDTARTTYSNAPVHVLGGAPPGQHTDGCPHAQVSPMLETRRWQATKIPPVSARLETAHSGSHAKRFFPERVVISRSITGLGGLTAPGRVPTGHAVQLRTAIGTSPAARTTIGAADLFGSKCVVPPHCATRRWTTHENEPHGCLHPLGLEVVPLDGKRRFQFAHGRQGNSRFPFSHPPFSDSVFDCVSIPQPSKRHSVPSWTFCPQHRSSSERPLSECKSRGQWRTDQRVQRFEKSSRRAADYLTLPRRTRELTETFAPVAEGAILGTSQSVACTVV